MNYLTVPQAAAQINVSKRTMYRLVKEFKVPHYRVEGLVRIAPEDLTEFMRSHRVASNQEIEQQAARVA